MDYTLRIITLTTLMAIHGHGFGNFDEINRLNYGVYFTKRKDITMAQAKWSHTLAISLPNLDQYGEVPLPDCNFTPSCTGKCRDAAAGDYLHQRDLANVRFCPLLRNETARLNEIRSQYMASIRDSILAIRKLIPPINKDLSRVDTGRASRSKRAIEPFGFIYRKIFGLATNSDLTELASE